jgi:tetratricopeptide (TPR) repeat protein
MSFGNRVICFAAVVWLGVALSGCAPSGPGGSDAESEPHYVLGESRVNAMDYQGAIEAFQESLEVDPHSAAAHYQLAMLYDEKVPDPAAAIYHYEQYLKLNPNAGNADVIKQRIYRCKQELAADVLPQPGASAMQQQLEKLAAENRQLQDELDKWRAYYAAQMAAKTNPPAPQNNPAPQSSQNPAQPAQTVPVRQTVASVVRPANEPTRNTESRRTYIVVAGDTAIHIARRYGISLDALLAANPGLEPRRLRVGQVLSIPPP